METEYKSLDEMIRAYANTIAVIEDLGQARNEEVQKVLEPVQYLVDKINRDYEDDVIYHREHVAELEAMIKAEVLKIQATVKSERFMFVYNKGKKTWDGKRLEGYASAHPEILQMQNVGEPTVSVRKL